MLCPKCATIFTGTRPRLWTSAPEIVRSDDLRDLEAESSFEREALRPLHTDISHMAQSAVAGCTICDIVWRHFFRDKSAAEYLVNPMFYRNGQIHSYFGSGTHYRLLESGTLHRKDYSVHALDLQIGLNSPMDKDVPEYKDITLEPIADEPAIDRNSIPEPSKSIFGKYTFNTVQSWISTCKRDHHRCNVEAKQPAWYPTRLLDVSYRAPTDRQHQIEDIKYLFTHGWLPANCRLVEITSNSISGPYTTLSHRWDPFGKTTLTNVERRFQSIKAHEIPQTIQEAIQFTRALGIQYLWVDLLCIIQGDDEDLKRELKVMGKVYAHSMLNLEATVGNGKLMQERNTGLIKPCVVKPRWEGMEAVEYLLADFRFWDSRVHRSMCNTRAWITQERWLAPRVIHFTFDQLVWECRELEAAESFPRGLTKEAKSQSSIGFKAFTTKISPGKPVPSVYESRLADWHKILLTYGRSELTCEKDRLIAVSGVAERFSDILDDEWIAGLWRRCLPGELLWEVDKTRRSNAPAPPIEFAASHGLGIKKSYKVQLSERLRDNRYQAPSWSWASVLGDIIPGHYMLDGSDESMISVLDVTLGLLDAETPYGQLTSGHLQLHGTLYPLAIDPPDWTPASHRQNYMALPPTIHIAGLPKVEDKSPLLARSRELHAKMGLPPLMFNSHPVQLKADEPTDYLDVAKSFFLPVRKSIVDGDGNEYDGWHVVNGLVVMPTETKGQYVRLGTVSFFRERCEIFEIGETIRRDKSEKSDAREIGKDEELELKGNERSKPVGQVGVLTLI